MAWQWVGLLFFGFFLQELRMQLFFVCVWRWEKKNTAHMALIPSWRMLCAGELEAIQMQWSKQAYISQNNIEAANSCRISQTACLAATHSTRISRESWVFPGNILNTQTPFRGLWILHLPLSSLSVLAAVCLRKSSGDDFYMSLQQGLGLDKMYRRTPIGSMFIFSVYLRRAQHGKCMSSENPQCNDM